MNKDIKKEFDNLARMVQKGFSETVAKTEFTEFKNEMTEFQNDTRNNFRSLRNDVLEISNSFVD